ncbi:EscU/YscU/HrcU family type III secretion system export apparatus switch protein [Parendozoicomonas haliclonae]|uniref:Flagellar biosynthetic protein FlhB n=1 Tax=Parendozoicomonas haliclonae TaxID=1960125 RepID=A0A1X7AP21_9GAMM|nr:EscU/YscU/HrcU family type III secretion system export apparatus switch protein [Parendozoicomonas haliclonae]SMA49872.1 Yop protein translocation protein U [Parendozoicomonas haliclonae]
MAEQGSGSAEKTEPPSPFKLQEARKKGQVAKSIEVTSLFTFIAACIALISLWSSLLDKTRQYMAVSLNLADGRPEAIYEAGYHLLSFLGIPLPIMLIILVGSVIGNILQTGLLLTTHPLKPDIKKLNPITGFKRTFSMKMLFELMKSLLKIVILVLICWFLIPIFLPEWIASLDQELTTTLSAVISQAILLAGALLAGMLVIVILDFLFVRWQFLKQMRMSKQEVKDEHKRRDGDPLIKQKRREQQQLLRQNQSGMASIGSADVIITNPIHVAVAIRYDRDSMAAPIVVCKGLDQQALYIREQGRRYRIPIVSRPALARHLFKKTAVNGVIPVNSYLGVARVLQHVMQRKTKNKNSWRPS